MIISPTIKELTMALNSTDLSSQFSRIRCRSSILPAQYKSVTSSVYICYSAPYTPSTLVKNPVTGSLVVPLISPSVGVTVKENLSHTLMGLEYVKMYSLASPHTQSRTTVSVESRVVVLMSTQYSVRTRAFHITVIAFVAFRMSVMIVAIVQRLFEPPYTQIDTTHHEQLKLLWSIFQTLQYHSHLHLEL